MIDWKPFLRRWSSQFRDSSLVAPWSLAAAESCLWHPPADEAEVGELEDRLGLALPPSYRAFLLTTNGWRRMADQVAAVRPAHAVDYLRVEHEDMVNAGGGIGEAAVDLKYFEYGPTGRSDLGWAHVQTLIQVSDFNWCVYLLNPMAVTPDGEWEAWRTDDFDSGNLRFPSFAHLMRHEHKQFCREALILKGADGLPVLSMPDSNAPRKAARWTKTTIAAAPSYEELIARMRSEHEGERADAIRILKGKVPGWYRKIRKPEVIPAFAELLAETQDEAVGKACINAIASLAPDGVAPDSLVAAMSHPNSELVWVSMLALRYFAPNPRALEPLSRFVEQAIDNDTLIFAGEAIGLLGKIGHERAIPTLLRGLLYLLPGSSLLNRPAATALVGCGPAGFDALVAQVGHESPQVRAAVAVGLNSSQDPRAKTYLEKLKTDSVSEVRDRAANVRVPWICGTPFLMRDSEVDF